MAYLAVNQCGVECIFQNYPVRMDKETEHGYWKDKSEYDRQRRVTTDAYDGSIILPNGSIKTYW